MGIFLAQLSILLLFLQPRLSVTFTFCTHNLESSFVWILYLNRTPIPHPGSPFLRSESSPWWAGSSEGAGGCGGPARWWSRPEKRWWGEEPDPAPQPGLQAVLAWTGSQRASTPLNCAVAQLTLLQLPGKGAGVALRAPVKGPG